VVKIILGILMNQSGAPVRHSPHAATPLSLPCRVKVIIAARHAEGRRAADVTLTRNLAP